jgi:hypothetical protein
MPTPTPQQLIARASSKAGLASQQASIRLAASLSGQAPNLSEIELISLHAEQQLTDLIFNEANNITVNSGTIGTVVTYKPPPGALGILRWMALGLQNLSDYDTITWSLVVGGMPVYGFDSITGPIASILDPMPIFWPIFQNQAVQVLANNPSSSGVTVSKATALVRGTIFMAA